MKDSVVISLVTLVAFVTVLLVGVKINVEDKRIDPVKYDEKIVILAQTINAQAKAIEELQEKLKSKAKK